ncbi:hypothetical protein OIU34_11730 [Pararhizobium sp. BT-229]|uniref:hypothetical protein n=1 Tax=Pararhizobium sp. BT-229 TaxID=2986923 RepID=UPI0021F6F319|nr:hypothetical protein [Pararhizobium sp. BT-229]MCV9962569.1 hypothetical protein [Pararhizobium sp. BT-229]
MLDLVAPAMWQREIAVPIPRNETDNMGTDRHLAHLSLAVWIDDLVISDQPYAS